jgi:hypothetical protein
MTELKKMDYTTSELTPFNDLPVAKFEGFD